MFDPILVPTWLHFGTQNPPKSTQKSIPRGIQKMIDFWIDFLPKLAPFWDPSWDPRAAQDGPKTPPRIFFKFSKTPSGQLKRHKSIQDRNLVHFWSQNPMGYPSRASIFEVFSSFKFKFCWPLRVALSIQGCPVHFSSQYAISCKFPST